MKASFSNYMDGVSSIAGMTDAPKLPDDNDNIQKALDLMDSALAQAVKIEDENSGFWATLKSQFTGAQLDSMKGEVETFKKAAASMHDSGNKLINDSSATHDKVISFITSVKEISDISAIKDTAEMSKLSNLVSTVSKETATQVKAESKELALSIWDNIPLPVKIGGGIALGIGIIWKIKSL
jgi:hypothetical protein